MHPNRTLSALGLAALLLLGAATMAAADPPVPKGPDTVIYPHTSGERSPTAPDSDAWSRAPWLFGALALAAGGTWWFWRTRNQAGPGVRSGHKLGIEETRSLGNRQYLVVAGYEGKRLLLGVTPGRIKLLCDLSDDREVDP
jgi:flagellar protein FliO/FliZ